MSNIKVNVVDINKSKIIYGTVRTWIKFPFMNQDLKRLFKPRNKNLFFSTNIDKAIEQSEMIFVAVNTPTKTFGEGKGMAADLTLLVC